MHTVYVVFSFPTEPITVMKERRHACVYCRSLICKMARHLENVHRDEFAVKLIAAIPNERQCDREVALGRLMLQGDYNHNMSVFSAGFGQIIVARVSPNQSAESYIPCKHCLGFYMKLHVWRHAKICKEKPEGHSDKNLCLDGKALVLSAMCSIAPDEFNTIVLAPMEMDAVGKICRDDEFILLFGKSLFYKKGRPQAKAIRQKMRQLGRLLINLNSLSEQHQNLENYVSSSNFDLLITATLTTSEAYIDPELFIPTPNKPTLALQLGSSLRNCALMKFGLAARIQDRIIKDDMNDLLFLLDKGEWKNRVNSSALTTLYKRKSTKNFEMPVAKDIMTVRNYLIMAIENQIDTLENDPLPEHFRQLATSVLARIILFNRRRSGEAARLLVVDYIGKANHTAAYNNEIAASMSDLERHLAAQ